MTLATWRGAALLKYGSLWERGWAIEGRAVRSAMPGVVTISEHNSTMGNWVGVYNAKHNVLYTYWRSSCSHRVRIALGYSPAFQTLLAEAAV